MADDDRQRRRREAGLKGAQTKGKEKLREAALKGAQTKGKEGAAVGFFSLDMSGE